MDARLQRFHNPVRTVAGAGALSALAGLLGERRALLITFAEAGGLGLVERVRDQLGERLVGIHDRVSPHPDVADLGGLYRQVWSSRAEVLVALGGGSTIDSAKAVALGTEDGRFETIRDALRAKREWATGPRKALIAVPTTAGTGSEVTPWATVWDREAQRKHSLHHEALWPEAAVVDPLLMQSLPPAVTLQSGLDALSHALESIWNRHANPVSDALAVAAARCILDTLPALLRQPDQPDLRESMARAALQAGLAFSNTRTALAHSLSYPMTMRHGLPHGIACSFTLPLVARLAIGHDAGRDRVLGQALGPLTDAPARLEAFLHALGVHTRFSDYGVDAAEADALMAQALEGDRGRNFIGAPA